MMAYNHRKAEIEWLNWKEKEEKQLRGMGVDEDTIQRLHTYDWQQFKAERNFYEWQSDMSDTLEWAPQPDTVPFPVSWTVKMKKKQKETQDILSYHSQAAGCSDKARAKASGGRQPIEECGRTGL